MSRSVRHGSPHWMQALRAFTASRQQQQQPQASTRAASAHGTVPYSTTAARVALFDTIARAHLLGPPGFRLHPDSLPVLRHARWELMKEGTPRSQSVLLEAILRLYAEASQAYLYDPVPSLAERQALLLEQVQCIVEAKVGGVPITARHFRYALRSPQLSELGAELPQLLLREMGNSYTASENARAPPAPGADSSLDHSSAPRVGESVEHRAPTPTEEQRDMTAARADCAVGLASSGYTDEALELCTAAGFNAVVRRVAAQTRDGWRRAWALAGAVPLDLLLSVQPADEGWRDGYLEAARRCFAGSGGGPEAMESLSSFMRAWEQRRVHRRHHCRPQGPPRGSAHSVRDAESSTHGGSDATRESHPGGGRPSVPRRVVETCLAVCPAAQWREAVRLTTRYNASGETFPSPDDARSAGEDGALGSSDGGAAPRERAAVGRLMALLIVARQPQEVLRLFYGRAFDPQSLADASMTDSLMKPSAEFLSEADLRHAAVYNHTMLALARMGWWRQAMTFYSQIPVPVVSRHTHWTAARMFLVQPLDSPSSSLHTAAADTDTPCEPGETIDFREDTEAFAFCLRSLRRAWGPREEAAPASLSGPSTGKGRPRAPAAPFFPESDAVFEGMALWAAARRDTATVVWLAHHAPPTCRYTRLIALTALLRELDAGPTHAQPLDGAFVRALPFVAAASSSLRTDGDTGGAALAASADHGAGEEVARQLDALLGAPDVSVKQTCLATALLACSASASALFGEGSNHHKHHSAAEPALPVPSTAAVAPLRAEVAAALAATLGRQVNGSQDAMDRTATLLVEQALSLRHRQTQGSVPENNATTADGPARHPSFRRPDILSEVMWLAGSVQGYDACWEVVLQVLRIVREHEGLSMARAAPVLVSAGVRPDIALGFLEDD